MRTRLGIAAVVLVAYTMVGCTEGPDTIPRPQTEEACINAGGVWDYVTGCHNSFDEEPNEEVFMPGE